MNHTQYCDELEIEIDRFSAGLANADMSARVPTCPDWSIEDLTRHLGKVHRWATMLVSERATSRISLGTTSFDGDVVDAEWLSLGGRALVEVLRSANPDDPMWAWGADQHVRFWSRRQLHETFVHRLDLELATRTLSYIDPAIALDAADEFLANVKSDGDISLRSRDGRESELLRISATMPLGQWNVRLGEDDYEFVDSSGTPDAELSGPAGELLKVLLHRGELANSDVGVSGDETLAEYWLSRTAFQ
ncbi:MAG: maleylpyruvate isomerase family mycothiol-dependent enzyme [Acidimicrobiales bacterium]